MINSKLSQIGKCLIGRSLRLLRFTILFSYTFYYIYLCVKCFNKQFEFEFDSGYFGWENALTKFVGVASKP